MSDPIDAEYGLVEKGLECVDGRMQDCLVLFAARPGDDDRDGLGGRVAAFARNVCQGYRDHGLNRRAVVSRRCGR
jgi:hypothetical protein